MAEQAKTIFDSLPRPKIEAYLAEIANALESGTDKKKINSKLKIDEAIFDELFSIAKASRKNRKFKQKMFMNLDDLRFATPEEVAYYRAYRLECKRIVDLGCGIGGQTIPFSERSGEVVAVELDHRRIEYAKQNASMRGKTNISFIEGDLLSDSVQKKIGKADIVFYDSQRPPEESARSIDSVKPSIKEIIKAYSKITKNIAIEVPPQLTPDKIPKEFDCEKEYISYKGQLNRLTLYFGDLKRADRSVVSLPDGLYLSSENKDVVYKDYIDFGVRKEELKNYLHEVSEAVTQAGLLTELAKRLNLAPYAKQKRAVFFTSPILQQNPLLKNFYVLQKCAIDVPTIREALQKNDCASVTLRANIPPDRYWEERKKYERGLKGKKNLHLFLFDGEAVIAKEE